MAYPTEDNDRPHMAFAMTKGDDVIANVNFTLDHKGVREMTAAFKSFIEVCGYEKALTDGIVWLPYDQQAKFKLTED